MRTANLSLSLDSELIRRAKKMAKEQGTSLSSMFSRYMQLLLRERAGKLEIGPFTRQASGLIKLPPVKTDRELIQDPKFLRRVSRARQSLREGKSVRLKDLPE